MFKSTTFCLTVAALFSLTTIHAARADMMGIGPGFAIPDGNPTGASSVINFSVNELITDLSVSVDIEHDFVGNLTMTLTSPAGTVLDLMNDPGSPALATGYNARLSGEYRFVDTGGDFWMAAAAAGSGNIPVGDYVPTGPDDGTGTGLLNSLVGSFAGESTAGDWTLRIIDDVTFSTGDVASWSLDIQSVPEPSTIGLMVIALFGLIGSRRLALRREDGVLG